MLVIVVLFLYLSSALWLATSLRSATGALSAHGKRLIGLALGALAWLLHGYALCELVFRAGNLALTATAAASLVGWIIAAIAWLKALRQNRFAGLAAAIMVCVGLSAATMAIEQPIYTEAADNWTLLAHIVLAVLAYSLVAVGSVLALALLWLDKRLHRHLALGTLTSLPSVEALEAGMFQSLTAGFALLTLTLFSGFIFVDNLFAQHLAHKTILSCLAWLLLGMLLIGRWRFGWRGRVAARWALASFALLGLAYFGSKLVLENILGKHWN
jgi:ABC-type uncharacterized transport system permease subunit